MWWGLDKVDIPGFGPWCTVSRAKWILSRSFCKFCNIFQKFQHVHKRIMGQFVKGNHDDLIKPKTGEIFAFPKYSVAQP